VKWDVLDVKLIAPLELQVQFEDGTIGKLKFESSYFTGVFEALKNPFTFEQVYVDSGSVAWPGDLDLAPDAMYSAIKLNGEWVLR